MVVGDNKFRSMNFSYDANGRQVKATKANVADAWSVYDALGNRVATKVNDIWQFVIYDAFGKLVAEYGTQGEGVGGVSYVLQDWQGSVRASVNNNGFIQARFDFTAFGEEVSLGVGLRSLEQGYTGDATTKQGYGLTEKDSSGQNHTWFRKQEQRAGRWTSPDPYKKSSSVSIPQSWNKFSYVQSQPTNFIDPAGLQLQIYCQWWHTVYDGGPNDGKEVPGSARWLVCWTIDDGRNGGGRVDVDLGGGNAGNGNNDPDKSKRNKVNECFEKAKNTIVEQYDIAVDTIRENANEDRTAVIELFSVAMTIAFATFALTLGFGGLVGMAVALATFAIADTRIRNIEKNNIKAQRVLVNSKLKAAFEGCKAAEGL
jgi:RHS repeat-associated protein